MHRYALMLGSNRRSRHGSPAATLRAAVAALGTVATVERTSAIILTPALGPAGRAFANQAAVVTARLDPPALLGRLKAIERAFGRRPGKRWGPRVLDLDIALWSGGRWARRELVVPHRDLARRGFVLRPLAAIAPAWRDPATGLAVRHLRHRLTRSRPKPIGTRGLGS